MDGEGYDYRLDKLNSWKGILVILDILVMVLGLANFGICLWVRFDLDFREFVFEMDWYVIKNKKNFPGKNHS